MSYDDLKSALAGAEGRNASTFDLIVPATERARRGMVAVGLGGEVVEYDGDTNEVRISLAVHDVQNWVRRVDFLERQRQEVE